MNKDLEVLLKHFFMLYQSYMREFRRVSDHHLQKRFRYLYCPALIGKENFICSIYSSNVSSRVSKCNHHTAHLAVSFLFTLYSSLKISLEIGGPH